MDSALPVSRRADAAGELVARHARECGSLVADSLEQVRRRAAAAASEQTNKQTQRHDVSARCSAGGRAGGRAEAGEREGTRARTDGRAGGSCGSARADLCARAAGARGVGALLRVPEYSADGAHGVRTEYSLLGRSQPSSRRRFRPRSLPFLCQAPVPLNPLSRQARACAHTHTHAHAQTHTQPTHAHTQTRKPTHTQHIRTHTHTRTHTQPTPTTTCCRSIGSAV